MLLAARAACSASAPVACSSILMHALPSQGVLRGHCNTVGDRPQEALGRYYSSTRPSPYGRPLALHARLPARTAISRLAAAPPRDISSCWDLPVACVEREQPRQLVVIAA